MNAKYELRYADSEFEVRAAPGNKFKFRGYAAVFDTLSQDLGGFVETIAPSAFRKTMSDGAEVFAFWAHDSSEVLGSTRNGTLTLEDRADGLAFSIEVRDTAISEDRWAAVQRGDVVGTSFGFFAERDEWDHSSSPALRTLKEVRLLEVSPGVAFPAYPGAQSGAALRSIVQETRTVNTIPVKASPEPAPAPPDQAPGESARADLEYRQASDLDLLCARFGIGRPTS
jgi:HK97 family phage prohead protease